jgi:hypothetical protein
MAAMKTVYKIELKLFNKLLPMNLHIICQASRWIKTPELMELNYSPI